MYFGPPATSMRYFISLGHPPAPLVSPAESMLELSNTNFGSTDSVEYRAIAICEAWDASFELKLLLDTLIERDDASVEVIHARGPAKAGRIMKPFILLHRMAIVRGSYTSLC